MSRNKPTGSEGKGESVVERAVRGALAGYIYCERDLGITTVFHDGSVSVGVRLYIPRKSIDTMLRRERAQKREKARAKNDPGGYIGEALESIGDQKRAGKKKTKPKARR